MITKIGLAAGDIWKLLDQKTQLEMSEIMKQIPHSKELTLMALGWLVREGHVLLTQKENQMFVELRERKSS